MGNIFKWKDSDNVEHSATWEHISEFYENDKLETQTSTKCHSKQKTVSASKLKIKKKLRSKSIDKVQKNTNSYRLAPKLTRQHMEPTTFEHMVVQFATEVFSATVAAGMLTMVSRKALSPSSCDTINLIQRMNRLFDLFNSN